MRYCKGEVTDSQDNLNVKVILIHPSAGHYSGYPHISSNELHKEGLWTCLCRTILMQRPRGCFDKIFISAPASALVPGIPSSMENSMSLRAQPYLYSSKSHGMRGHLWWVSCWPQAETGSSQRKGRVGPWRYTPDLWNRQLKPIPCPRPLHSPVTAHSLVLTSLQVHFKLASLCKPKCKVLGMSQHSLPVHSFQTAIEHFLQNVGP